MFFYVFLILVFYLLFTMADYHWPYKWQKRALTILSCVILFFIAIFRFDVGYDYPTYYNSITIAYADELETFEPLSRLFVQIAAYFDYPWLIFVLFGIPTYIFAFIACKRSGNFQLAFWTYVFLFLFSSFGAIRQAAAISTLMFAIYYIKERRLFIYIILCIVASLFHISALIMLPIYFVYHYVSWKLVLLSMIAMAVFFPIVFTILLENDVYTYYLRSTVTHEGGSLMRYFYIGLYVLLLFIAYKEHLLKETKHSFVALIPALFFPFLFGGHLGGRLSWNLYPFYIYLIPQIISHCGKKMRMAFMLMLCTVFFMFLYVSIVAADKSAYTPYKTIFNVDLEHPKFKD